MGVALVVVAGLGYAGVRYAHRHHLHLKVPSLHLHPESIADLKQDIKKNPNDAKARVLLGEKLFAQHERLEGIHAYDRALALDHGAVNSTMIDDLNSCFGHSEQGDAASVLVRFKLTDAASGLKEHARSKNYKERWGAVQTLDRLGKASRADFVNAWIADLDSSDCNVRKHAVEELGKEGDKRALAALRVAKQKDQATKTGFIITHTCLGNSVDQAEKAIARR